MSVLLQTEANYGYSNSWLRAMAVVFGHFYKTLFRKRKTSQTKDTRF